MSTGRPLNVLLLCNRPARGADASTVTDHLDAFPRYSRHRVTTLSFLRDLPSALHLDRFDVVVIHYTIAIGYLSEHYINPAAKARVRDFRGLKVAFIQDEYRGINRVVEALNFMAIDLLFTCVPEGEIGKVYAPNLLAGLRAVNNLTGYVPERALRMQVARIADRPIDVGYRTRKPPYWLGELGVEKWRIADGFKEALEDTGLKLDLSYHEADRLYGIAWIEFVASCRAMLGVESGASVFDFDGTLQRTVDEYVATHPQASFEEVQQRFLRPYEGRIRLNQISPRCFEAAALRTAMVLFEGEYSGILEPERHYIPLRKDFGNIDEVVARLRQPDRLQELVDRTYEEVACNPAHSYRRFVELFDAEVEQEFERRGKPAGSKRFSRAAVRLDLVRSPAYLLHQASSRTFQWLLLGTPIRKVLFRLWGRVPVSSRQIIRPLLRLIGR